MRAYEPGCLCFLFSALLLISCTTPDRSLNLCGLLLPHSYGGIILTYLREGCEGKLVFRKDCWSTRCKVLLCWVLHQWETNLTTENQFNIWSSSSQHGFADEMGGCPWEWKITVPHRSGHIHFAYSRADNDRQGLEGEGGGEDLKLILPCDFVHELLSVQKTDTR